MARSLIAEEDVGKRVLARAVGSALIERWGIHGFGDQQSFLISDRGFARSFYQYWTQGLLEQAEVSTLLIQPYYTTVGLENRVTEELKSPYAPKGLADYISVNLSLETRRRIVLETKRDLKKLDPYHGHVEKWTR